LLAWIEETGYNYIKKPLL